MKKIITIIFLFSLNLNAQTIITEPTQLTSTITNYTNLTCNSSCDGFAHKLVTVLLVVKLGSFHWKLYGRVPPETVTFASPVQTL